MSMMVNQLQCSLLILFVAVYLSGFPMPVTSSNLRTGLVTSVTEESTIIPDSDLVDISSYLVVQLDGYDMQDLKRMSPKKQAVIECAFHEAFNEVHGDHDGLYLSGQQIVAMDRANTEDDNDDAGGDETSVEGIELRARRPRKFPPKSRDRPTTPPPRSDYKHPWEDNWNMYWHTETSGMCTMCIDDDWYDPVDGIYESLSLVNDKRQKETLELASKRDRARQAASDYVMSESSLNAMADALRKNLIEGSCVDDQDDSFEYVEKTDIYVLSQSEFEESVAAIAASAEVRDDAARAFPEGTATDLVAAPAATAVLPFFYGESFPENIDAATAGDGFLRFKIGLSGVDCGPWNKEDLLDLNSALHDAINSMGLTDLGHVMDRIETRKPGRKPLKPRFRRRYDWKCKYNIYAKLGVDRTVPLTVYILDDIGDALCDNLGQFGWKNKFRNVIDCQVDPVSETDYRSIFTLPGEEKAGLPVSSARE